MTGDFSSNSCATSRFFSAPTSSLLVARGKEETRLSLLAAAIRALVRGEPVDDALLKESS